MLAAKYRRRVFIGTAILVFTGTLVYKPKPLTSYFANAYYKKGNAHYQLKDYQGAINSYNQAIHLNPYNADAHMGLGNARYELKDYQEAINSYNQAIHLDPNNSTAYNIRGLAHYQLGFEHTAIQDLKKAASLGNTTARKNLGIIRDD